MCTSMPVHSLIPSAGFRIRLQLLPGFFAPNSTASGLEFDMVSVAAHALVARCHRSSFSGSC